MIFIRCDSSVQIASGHVMRCLNLAQALKARGQEVHFICRDLEGNFNQAITQSGFSFTLISKTATDTDADIDQIYDARETLRIIQSLSKATHNQVIVDNYGILKEWQKNIKESGLSLVVIDDLADRPHICDIIINQNAYNEEDFLYNKLTDETANAYIGPQYALLSEQYGAYRRKKIGSTGSVKRIVTFFGGRDEPDMTGKTLLALINMKMTGVLIDVVCGKSYTHRKDLSKLAEKNDNVTVHGPIQNFAAFLDGASLFVGAGGVTQLERCCLGIPGVVVAIADNQVMPSQRLCEVGASLYLGWHEDLTVDRMQQALSDLINDHKRLHSMAKKSHALVDGQGSSRVADIVVRL